MAACPVCPYGQRQQIRGTAHSFGLLPLPKNRKAQVIRLIMQLCTYSLSDRPPAEVCNCTALIPIPPAPADNPTF